MPFCAVILQSMPECYIFSWLGLQLINISPDWKRLLLASIIFGIISYWVRGLFIPFGVHILIQTVFLVIIFKLLLKLSVYQSLSASLIANTTVAVFEAVFIPSIMAVTGLNLDTIISSDLLRIIIPVPHMIIALILIVILKKNDLYIVDLEKDFSAKG